MGRTNPGRMKAKRDWVVKGEIVLRSAKRESSVQYLLAVALVFAFTCHIFCQGRKRAHQGGAAALVAAMLDSATENG